MRGLFCVLPWLVLHASADVFGSLFGDGLDGVTKPLSTGVSDAGSNTFAAASSLGQGLQAVGQPLGSLASVSAGAAKSIGGGLEDVGKPIGTAVKAAGSTGVGAAQTVGQKLKKEVQAAKHPVDVTISYVGSSQCQNVQKILGVSYDQLQDDNEPNLNDLELVYKTKYFTTTMNISMAPESLGQARQFDQDERLVVFFHGFTDDPSKTSFSTIAQAYLEHDRMSIIALDASSLIRWFYVRASVYVKFIGEVMGKTLAAMMKLGQDPAKIHLVAHSLGAHIAGYTGKMFYKLTGEKIGRITGLDPAGPCFSNLDPELRLHHSDAEYVDAIHTDAGVYGLADPVGHKDYYPNGGNHQPDCVLQTCSHSRAWELFAESVTDPEAFYSVRCRDWRAFREGDCEHDTLSKMGYSSEPGDEGSFFLQTNTSSPFGMGVAGCTYRNTDGLVRNVGYFVG